LEDGRLMGTYTMIRGTGLDVWRQQRPNGTVYISEIHSLRDGRPDGFTWFFWDGEASVWSEEHFQSGDPQGIERRWNTLGGLCRGYPRYYVQGKRVKKREYIRAAAPDPTLPPFRAEDNLPLRILPVELRKKLGLDRQRKAPTHAAR
jgi:hypothetical protein